MATHIYHPDTIEAGLCDECPECRRRAKDPLSLDSQHFADLWQRMVAVERQSARLFLAEPYSETRSYRSGAEADACRTLYTMAVILERYTSVLPWTWPL
jgi:hypothetical protein